MGILVVRFCLKQKYRDKFQKASIPNQISNQPGKCFEQGTYWESTRESHARHSVFFFGGVVTSGEGFTVTTKVLPKSYFPP